LISLLTLLHLEIICKVKQQRPAFNFSTTASETALWEEYVKILEEREQFTEENNSSGLLISRAAELARKSLLEGSPTVVLDLPLKPIEARLKRLGIIICQEERIFRFRYEKFQDYLYAWYACGQGSLPSVIRTEVSYHRRHNILSLMEAIYAAKNSSFLLLFLKEVFESDELAFFSQTAVLERYIYTSNPSENPNALAVIIKALQDKKDLYKWFFANQPHSHWAGILYENGFLNVVLLR
jgi:hypothetical protein